MEDRLLLQLYQLNLVHDQLHLNLLLLLLLLLLLHRIPPPLTKQQLLVNN